MNICVQDGGIREIIGDARCQEAIAALRFEMLMPWLTLICKTGECFRKHTQS